MLRQCPLLLHTHHSATCQILPVSLLQPYPLASASLQQGRHLTAVLCSDPVNIYLGGLATVGGVAFVRDWHATLQTVGLWGLLLTTGNWARKTEDPGVGLEPHQE